MFGEEFYERYSQAYIEREKIFLVNLFSLRVKYWKRLRKQQMYLHRRCY